MKKKEEYRLDGILVREYKPLPFVHKRKGGEGGPALRSGSLNGGGDSAKKTAVNTKDALTTEIGGSLTVNKRPRSNSGGSLSSKNKEKVSCAASPASPIVGISSTGSSNVASSTGDNSTNSSTTSRLEPPEISTKLVKKHITPFFKIHHRNKKNSSSKDLWWAVDPEQAVSGNVRPPSPLYFGDEGTLEGQQARAPALRARFGGIRRRRPRGDMRSLRSESGEALSSSGRSKRHHHHRALHNMRQSDSRLRTDSASSTSSASDYSTIVRAMGFSGPLTTQEKILLSFNQGAMCSGDRRRHSLAISSPRMTPTINALLQSYQEDEDQRHRDQENCDYSNSGKRSNQRREASPEQEAKSTKKNGATAVTDKKKRKGGYVSGSTTAAHHRKELSSLGNKGSGSGLPAPSNGNNDTPSAMGKNKQHKQFREEITGSIELVLQHAYEKSETGGPNDTSLSFESSSGSPEASSEHNNSPEGPEDDSSEGAEEIDGRKEKSRQNQATRPKHNTKETPSGGDKQLRIRRSHMQRTMTMRAFSLGEASTIQNELFRPIKPRGLGTSSTGTRFWKQHVLESKFVWPEGKGKTSDLVDVNTSWQLELGSEFAGFGQPLHVDMSQFYYTNFLAPNEHYHFFFPKEKDPFILTIAKFPDRKKKNYIHKAMLRSKKKDELFFVTVPHGMSPKKRARALREAHPLLSKASLLQLPPNNMDLNERLVSLEKKLSDRQFRVGVLQIDAGRNTENEWYTTDILSPDLKEFMDLLGTLVEPGDDTMASTGLPRYKGGLPSSERYYHSELFVNDMTLQVAFHVCPLIRRRSDDDPSRKRYIGNDIVVILFKDPESDYLFNPRDIRSNMNSIFIVVEPHSDSYKVSLVAKSGVPPILPLFPDPAILPKSGLRDFFLTKIVNGNFAAFQSRDFHFIARTKAQLLNEIIAEHVPKSEKRQKKAGTFLPY